MKPKNDRKEPGRVARRSLRIRKLEERIAPAAHFNPRGKLVGGSHGGTW